MLKKLLLAGVLALGATQANAGVSTRQWHEGMFTCRLAKSPDVFEAYITTQQGELTGWGRLTKWSNKPRVDHVQPRGDVVSFYVDSSDRSYVEIRRTKRRWGKHPHGYSSTLIGKLVLRGKRWDMTCTRR